MSPEAPYDLDESVHLLRRENVLVSVHPLLAVCFLHSIEDGIAHFLV